MIWHYGSMYGRAPLNDSDIARGDEKMAVESLIEMKLPCYYYSRPDGEAT